MKSYKITKKNLECLEKVIKSRFQFARSARLKKVVND